MFEELDNSSDFQNIIAYTEHEYYARLTAMVHKFVAPTLPACINKTYVISNGVPDVMNYKTNYSIQGNPKIAVSGRIASTKFIIEIIKATKIVWGTIPNTELHIYGGAESYNETYYDQVINEIGTELNSRIFLQGVNLNVVEILYKYDAYVVLGLNQGCPNALMEALISGLPVIGNDDGGTREQIINNETGVLIDTCSPISLANSLIKILQDREFAEKVGKTGRQHMLNNFSMQKMAESYLKLLNNKTEIQQHFSVQ